MEEICLKEIKKSVNTLKYCFEVTEGLCHFFSERDFIIAYPEPVENIPDYIAAVPFVCNVLPIIWLTNSKLIVSELDEEFFQCISELKKGYEDMYPETSFGGDIHVERVITSDQKTISDNCAMFYSGGLDSMDTLYRHLNEKPVLITIWGSDVRCDNTDGWHVLHNSIAEAAQRYQLNEVIIRSSFREFDKESELDRVFSKTLQRNYWYGIKHSLALLGHVAPYAYLHGLAKMYIASSNCVADGKIRCASDPRIDNHVRFAGCKVIHDAFDCTRQDKIHNIVEYNKKVESVLPLHVCYEVQTGKNCCWCEKCYRTMIGLIMEGADPKEYGFQDIDQSIPYMHERIVYGHMSAPKTWGRIHKDFIARKQILKKSVYWKYIKWLLYEDFSNPKNLKMPLLWRLKNYLYQQVKRRH